jgi:hypothetical protein
LILAVSPANCQTLAVTSGGQTVGENTTVSINTIPNMPNLVLSINGGTSCDSFSYVVSVTYTDQAGAMTGHSYSSAADIEGDTSSTVDWSWGLEGGTATIAWEFDGSAEQAFTFYINGTNPSNSIVDSYLAGGAAPWFAQNLVAYESRAWSWAPSGRYKQFDSSGAGGGCVVPGWGCPIWGTPDGIGLMQLEPPARASSDQDFWAWSWNIADGIHWLYNEKQGPAYNSWNNEFQQMQADMAPGVRYPPDSDYTYCYFSYPQNNNDTYADGDWIHYYNGDYFIFWNHTNLSWDIDSNGYVSKVCNTRPL